MDFFSHGLWSYIIFHRSKYVLLAILFGILPDILSWTIFMVYPLKNGFTWKNPDLSLIPKWVFTLYNVTHSLVVIALIFLIVYIIFRRIPLFLFALPLHILIDIPTHSRDFLPTPFLWPISNWYFPGISWGNRYFLIANYSLIIILLLYINYKNITVLFENIKHFLRKIFVK